MNKECALKKWQEISVAHRGPTITADLVAAFATAVAQQTRDECARIGGAELEYELRVAGPDDVIVFSYELEALQRANEINRQYLLDRLAHPGDEVLCVATVHEVVKTPNG